MDAETPSNEQSKKKNINIILQIKLYVTLFQLDMEDGDAIDVFQQQTGGILFSSSTTHPTVVIDSR